MLTPQDITEKTFVKAVFGGYYMTGVDNFLETVAADYSALYKENAILKGKLKVLVEKVEEYRSTEDSMRMALLTAQRVGEEIKTEANKQREAVLKDASEEIRARLTQTARRVADEELRLEVAAKETSKFIELSLAIMRRHSEFLSKLETACRTVRQEPEQPQPSREDHEVDVADQIGDAVQKLTDSDPSVPYSVTQNFPQDEPMAQGPPYGAAYPPDGPHQIDHSNAHIYASNQQHIINDAPTVHFNINDERDAPPPKPKFDFDDLKFGANFEKK